jgi:putative restriction endonuclease
MAERLDKKELLYIISQAIFDCGWNLIYLSEKHPFKLKIFNGKESYFIKIIIYNITHGGGYKRSANEYRIQMKEPNLEMEENYKTLILGYYSELNIFAGWDIQKHLGHPGYSSSFQIREENLSTASISGFSPCNKGNEEIAIAFKPDMFVEYIRNLEVLHAFGKSNKDFSILNEVTKDEILQNNELIDQLTIVSRKNVLRTINQKQRDNNFRSKVLRAYNYRCAFTGIQLKLVDAAHIVPVNYEKSTDDTSNGIALSSICHRAYDKGLITFNERYKIIINEIEVKKLQQEKLYGGFEKFKNSLRPIIDVPPSISDRPNTKFIELANKLRGWR